ncbi:MAG: hypothetical protein KBA60_12000 [Flavobacteriales bacterium]|nr:hypothetical protein [Flavobacteriales bacterium]
MLQSIEPWISGLFVVSTAVTLLLLFWAMRSRTLLIGVLIWAFIQAALGLSGFFSDTTSLPPRVFAFGVLPAVIAILVCLATPTGRAFMDRADLRKLTWLHTIRIPVEIVLFLLVERHFLSTYMSVHGTNFDVLSGLSAPFIALFAFRNGVRNKPVLVIWNVIALALLLNVVITAAFCIPSPIQQLAFDQPNVAVLYFPMNLLPTVVVPIVLFAHVIAFRQLLNRK